jgi:hypothetical protein
MNRPMHSSGSYPMALVQDCSPKGTSPWSRTLARRTSIGPTPVWIVLHSQPAANPTSRTDEQLGRGSSNKIVSTDKRSPGRSLYLSGGRIS